MTIETFSGAAGALFSAKARRSWYLGVPLLLAGATAAGQAPAAAAPAAATPAASPLPRLLAERRVLTQRYAAAKARRNSLFGLSDKPSKKDLQAVVDALQGIVNKDEQIVTVLNQTAAELNHTAQQAQVTATTLQNTTRDDRNLTTQRLAELQDTQLNVEERERQANARLRNLEAELLESQKSGLWRDGLIAVLGAACVGLLLWRRSR